MSNTIKFNKTLLASVIAASMLTACGGDDGDTNVEPADVTVTPPSVDVVVEAPEMPAADSATLSVKVTSATTRAPLAGVAVQALVNGNAVDVTTDANGSVVMSELPVNADVQLIFTDASGMYATAYSMFTTDEGMSSDAVSVEMFEAIDSSVAITSVTGEAIVGATLYIPGMYFGAGAPDVVATESATEAGSYTFAALPDNGDDFQIISTGDLMNAAGDVVEVIGVTAAPAAIAANTAAYNPMTVQYLGAGENVMTYVDSVSNPTIFTLSFDLSINGGEFVDAPATINLMAGSQTVVATLVGNSYVADLTAAQALSTVTVEAFTVGDSVFAVTEATLSTGLATFAESTSVSASLTTELVESNDVNVTVAHKVLSEDFVAGQSARVVIAFEQPVELVDMGEANFDISALKDSTSSIYAYPYRMYRYGEEYNDNYTKVTAKTETCFTAGWFGPQPCASTNVELHTPFEDRDDKTQYFYQNDAQVAAGLGDYNAAVSALAALEGTLATAEEEAGYDAAAATATYAGTEAAIAEAEAAYTDAQAAVVPAAVSALEVSYDEDLVAADATLLAADGDLAAATAALGLAQTDLDAAVAALDALDGSATVEEITAANALVLDTEIARDAAQADEDAANNVQMAAATAQGDAATLAAKDTATLQAEADAALVTAFDNVVAAVQAFEDAGRDEVYLASLEIAPAQTAMDDAWTAAYSFAQLGTVDYSNWNDKLKVNKTGLFMVKTGDNKSGNVLTADKFSFNADNTVLTIELDATNLLDDENLDNARSVVNGASYNFDFTVRAMADDSAFESKSISVTASNPLAADMIDNLVVASGAGKDVQNLAGYDLSAGTAPTRSSQPSAKFAADNMVTLDRTYTDGDSVVHNYSFPIVDPTSLSNYCTATDCKTNADSRLSAKYTTVNPVGGTNTVSLLSPVALTGTVEVVSVTYAEKWADSETGEQVITTEEVGQVIGLDEVGEDYYYIADVPFGTIVAKNDQYNEKINSTFGTDMVVTGFHSDVADGAYYTYTINPYGDSSLDHHITEVTVSFNLTTADGEAIVGEKTYTIK
ncbi:hypothetical protein RI845_12695 [Thalassotalea nanhaiensis]|uniref:Uncharacterized protein n=1 Tax=Thalassotalea nanhaiensis TaxID=3065648 RepID=A0ABY9TF82_9GAMM|nr:hypothetical protein RI845_12695 [Colwelliaceae bacterium SQ345]